MARMLLWAPFI